MDPFRAEEFSERPLNPRLFAPRGGRRNPGATWLALRGLQEGIKWGVPTNPVDAAIEGGLAASGGWAARRVGAPLMRGAGRLIRGGWNRGMNLRRMLGRRVRGALEQRRNYRQQRLVQ